jgi:hypothetical protein
MIKRIGLSIALVALALQAQPAAAGESAIVRPSEADKTAGLSDVTVGSTSVSGTLTNKSSTTLREVHLVLRQEFRWKDEMHPGDPSPGRVLPYTVNASLAPNASTAFKFEFEPLPERTDGHFTSSIEVTGFTTVEP